MPKDDVTLAQVLEAVNNGFNAMEAKMATKDDLAALKTELVEFVAGEIATLRSEDIEPMKRDIATVKQDAEKIRNTFAPRVEYDDRLRIIEQKLGIPSPQ